VLREVDLVACEDTRRTRALLAHFDIHVPTTPYHEHNKAVAGPALLRRLRDGAQVALVTDAGTPAVADPGVALVRDARAAGVGVVPVPGPSAVTALLSVAGVPAHRFHFEGFLPVKPGKRRHRLQALRTLDTTVVLYEAPHRIAAALEAIRDVFGDVEIVVARELTKQFEEIHRDTPSAHLARLARAAPRGEFALVLPPVS